MKRDWLNDHAFFTGGTNVQYRKTRQHLKRQRCWLCWKASPPWRGDRPADSADHQRRGDSKKTDSSTLSNCTIEGYINGNGTVMVFLKCWFFLIDFPLVFYSRVCGCGGENHSGSIVIEVHEFSFPVPIFIYHFRVFTVIITTVTVTTSAVWILPWRCTCTGPSRGRFGSVAETGTYTSNEGENGQ